MAWQEKIRAARGNDAALLELAHQAPSVELKVTAIESLTQEESFRRAMRELGEHDKRLYRAARSGLETISGRRKATAEANALIASARSLLEQGFIPVNRAVELDHAWGSLDAGLIEPGLAGEFARLSAQIGERARARGEGEQAIRRWIGAVEQAMARLASTLGGVAQGEVPPSAAQPHAAALLELAAGVPDAGDARCVEKKDAANRVLALASSVVQRAEFLLALPAPGTTDEASDKAMVEQWRGIPEVHEAGLQEVLAQRFADWRNAGIHERQLKHDARRAQEQKQRAEQERERLAAIEAEVKAAEAALAGGQVAELTRHIAAVERATKHGAPGAALARRIDALHRGHARLRDWQRWSGRQGREQLVAEAQALQQAAGGKVAVKAHAEAIDKLRERWKELDKLGAASNQALWLAFDGALKAAYAPVAAHLEKQKAAREENLAARNRVIERLAEAAAGLLPKSDWRAVSRALGEAQVEWRKLGPVEHTVPRKALQGAGSVPARYAAALQALEAPLKDAYAAAARQREELIATAKGLAGSRARDSIDQVRALQSQWQAQAKALALPRREENALWTAFKAATDAVFEERDAARRAREAELEGRQKAREEIIARLGEIASGSSAAEMKRQLTQADAAWRTAPDAPRPLAAKLDARYRAARETVTRRLSALAAGAAQARFDALIAAMALCDELESSAAPREEIEARWNALENLPDAWKKALEQRLRGAARPAAKLPELLLKLEAACAVESPPEFRAERQRLKLLALKEAMESRRGAASAPQDVEAMMLEAAATPRPDALSRERLAKIIAAVRRQPHI